MKLYADLHIHSCLSPCGEDDMTPNNIVNMAFLKGLDVIAITDHNAAANISAAHNVALERDIVLLPGMEVQSKEEVHCLCYFPEPGLAEEFAKLLHASMPRQENRKEIFGNQLIMDSNDELVGEEQLLLVQSTGFSIHQLARMALERGGVMVPAHINRRSYALLANLGFIPPDLQVRYVEVHKASPAPTPPVTGYGTLYSSDAHQLGDISEPDFMLEAPERSAAGVISALRGGL